MDEESIEVLKTIAKFSGKATWYPLARRTRHSIRGLLFSFEQQGLIFAEEKYLIDEDRTERFYSITDFGLETIALIDTSLDHSQEPNPHKPSLPENPE